MKFELFVALRYLFSLRHQAFISLISLFAVFGVFIGVAALIVTLGVMSGFTHDLREKILGVNAHVLVGTLGSGISDYQELSKELKTVPDVTGVMPFVYSEVMLSTPKGVKGVILRGINPESATNVLSLKEDMTMGELSDLDDSGKIPGIIVGKELASRLGLHVGARVNLLSPAGKRTAAGFQPKIKKFKLVGVFKTGMYEYDSTLAYVTIPAAQKLLGYKGDIATAIEVRIKDVEKADVMADTLRDKLSGKLLYVRDWMEMNRNLFAALKLEKTAMFVILVMIILVGTFSIITTLVMLVIQKTRDIAILMSMGTRPRVISRIFMLQGMLIGLVGTALGFAGGLSLCWALKKYQFIKLPKNVYPVEHVPIRLDSMDLALVGGAALLLCFFSTLYPARKAARLNPSEALRYE